VDPIHGNGTVLVAIFSDRHMLTYRGCIDRLNPCERPPGADDLGPGEVPTLHKRT
jgi:hypothetical protein